MADKKITIKIRSVGNPIIKIKVYEGITIREVVKENFHFENDSLLVSINGKKKSLGTVLNNNDFLSLILPFHGEATVRRNGKSWRINKNDRDEIFPSDFHAHNLETGEKLDLYTGYLYNPVTKKLLWALHKKDWIAILSELKTIKDKSISLKANTVLSLLNNSAKA